MTPEQWSRLRTYEPSGSFDNPDPEAGMAPTPYQRELAAKLKRGLWYMLGGIAAVLLILLVTSSKP